jgi:hypothetical protein
LGILVNQLGKLNKAGHRIKLAGTDAFFLHIDEVIGNSPFLEPSLGLLAFAILPGPEDLNIHLTLPSGFAAAPLTVRCSPIMLNTE